MEDKHELLNDILQDAAPPEFRAASLAETLNQVRLRKKQRHRNRVAVALGCFLVTSIIAWRIASPQKQALIVQAPKSVAGELIINSQPLPVEMILKTNPNAVESVSTKPHTIKVVETTPGEKLFTTIGDNELLTLLAGRPALLIRKGPSESELHFVNPDDSNELFVR